MKVKIEHYNELVKVFKMQSMQKLYATCTLDVIAMNKYKNLELAVAYRFSEIAWQYAHKQPLCEWICKTIYPYGCNDTHFETALMKAIKEAGLYSVEMQKELIRKEQAFIADCSRTIQKSIGV